MIWARENDFDDIIKERSAENGVPWAMTKAIIAKESSFNPRAYKEEPQIPDASTGLMQVLLGTAKRLGFALDINALADPATNIEYGTKLLSQNLARAGGDFRIAVAAYNAGWSKVRKNDAPRDSKGRFINESYVDDVQVYYGYFAGSITEAGVKDYLRSKTIHEVLPFTLLIPLGILLWMMVK